MVQETMAHIQTATWFVLELMSFVVPQDIHSNQQFWSDRSICPPGNRVNERNW